MIPTLEEGDEADIGLLLEGTYPYIRGGVSGWVHQLISGLPEYRFALIFMGDKPDTYADGLKYELPDNVVHLESHYLMTPPESGEPDPRPGKAQAFEHSWRTHAWFRDTGSAPPLEDMHALLGGLATDSGISLDDFNYSEQAWFQITDSYQEFSTEKSFLDYFWTVRAMHGPIFRVAEMANVAARAKVYHAVSTGYAGLLGSMLHIRRQRPYMLTEHGIYTKERKIDLAQVDWIKDAEATYGAGMSTELSYLRRLWIRLFEGMGRLAYLKADPILAITEANKNRQIADGASPARVEVIPNGVNIDRFKPLREIQPASPPPVVCFIGRVVPIKDVKTFIRAMRTICTRVPEAEAWIIGNEDEDQGYADECHALVRSLGIEDRIKFLGFQRIDELLPKVRMLVMTSISEGLPLVIIECFAAGVPAIVTDVGACRELVEGGSEKDQALGSAGAVTAIADPQATAQECIRMIEDDDYWRSARAAGIRRVEALYTEHMLFENYRRVYGDALAKAGD
ncbi:MAG: GT4 family glycosyltransferase PelF [Gammaproteobacteria bacterium]